MFVETRAAPFLGFVRLYLVRLVVLRATSRYIFAGWLSSYDQE